MKTTLATASWALMVACLTLASCTEQPEAPSFVLSPDGVPIHYETHGTGNPALVFVHGWSCDRTYWNAQVPAFSGDRRVVMIDIEAIFEPFRADFIGTTKVWVRENGLLPTSDPELVEWVAEDMAAGPPVVGLEAGAEMWRWLGEPSRTALRDLQVPGILINSDLGNTDVAAIREYASVPFDAVLMSGVGHFVMMEDPETFNALLSEAIAGFLH